MIRTPAINTAEITRFVPGVVNLLSPFFHQAEATNEPRGPRVLYIDNSLEKKDPMEGPRMALSLLKEISPQLSRHQGTLILFEQAHDARVLTNELILQAKPHEVCYVASRLPAEQADLGVCIDAGVSLIPMGLLLSDGVRKGGLALIHMASDLSADFDSLSWTSLELIMGVQSPSDDAQTLLFRRRD